MSYENYGSYELIKKLATGGMAQIYLARQKGLEGFEKLLVVKRILPHLAENQDFITMFLDEARIAARLDHPNVVQIFNLGSASSGEGESYFIAMEYIHGEDVRRVWKTAESRKRPLPIPLVCRVIMDSCAGLDYAHKKADQQGRPLGIVHRDISPQNILITFDGGVKVVDFGIAKAADQSTVTRSGVLKGKYSYMSPEQASGKKIDCRTDIFALGVVLFELLTGRRLFKRANDILTLNAVAECNVPPPSNFAPNIPPELDAIVLKALARDPDDRYREAVQLQVALEEWLLKQQLVSSSAHLAAFMQEIYAERLAEERQVGEPRPDPLTSETERPSEEFSPSPSRAKSPTTKKTPTSRPEKPPKEDSTTAARPKATNSQAIPTVEVRRADAATDPKTRTVDRQDPSANASRSTRSLRAASPQREDDAAREEATQFSAPEEPEAREEVKPRARARGPAQRRPEAIKAPSKSRKAVWLMGGAAVAMLVATAVVWSRPETPPPSASVRIETDPAGARVEWDGRLLEGTTPLTVPGVEQGRYAIRFSLPDYKTRTVSFEVAAEGDLIAGPYLIDPEDRPTVIETQPPEVQPVVLRFRSDPGGAKLFVDGREQGTGAIEHSAMPGSSLKLRAELSQHKTWEREVTLSELPTQELVAALEKIERTVKKGENGSSTTQVAGTRSGQIRFVVEPWGKVTCNGNYLGETPFREKTLPAGTYDCQISNDEFPTQKRRIEVRANELVKVIVNFTGAGGGGGGP